MHLRLQIVKGPAQGRSFTFSRPERLTAGRASENQLRLDEDDEISPHHFLIEINPPNLRVRDLGSRSGTFVNDAPDAVSAALLLLTFPLLFHVSCFKFRQTFDEPRVNDLARAQLEPEAFRA